MQSSVQVFNCANKWKKVNSFPSVFVFNKYFKFWKHGVYQYLISTALIRLMSVCLVGFAFLWLFPVTVESLEWVWSQQMGDRAYLAEEVSDFFEKGL